MLVVCGAPLAARAADIEAALRAAGWRVQVVATPSADAWLAEPSDGSASGRSVRAAHRDPSEPKPGERASTVVVAPITFNTVGKLVAGIADTYAHSVLAEALGEGVPIIGVPMVNNRLWGNPAWLRNVESLKAAGVRLIDIQTGRRDLAPVRSGTGPEVVANFDPGWILDELTAAVAGHP
jgi:phosphopantothenoylcysteine synthetase/decarboxylase